MEEGKTRVRIVEFRWGWVYVEQARTYVYTIIGVWAFSKDGRVYELSKPVSIAELEKHCEVAEPGRFPEYACSESFIERLIACNK